MTKRLNPYSTGTTYMRVEKWEEIAAAYQAS